MKLRTGFPGQIVLTGSVIALVSSGACLFMAAPSQQSAGVHGNGSLMIIASWLNIGLFLLGMVSLIIAEQILRLSGPVRTETKLGWRVSGTIGLIFVLLGLAPINSPGILVFLVVGSVLVTISLLILFSPPGATP